MSIVFTGLAAVVAIASAAFVYAFVAEYGPTTGSRLDGATAGLGAGAVGLVVVAGLAVAGLVVGRRWLAGRIAAVVVLAAALVAVVATGAQAAVVKFEGLPKVPDCTVDGSSGTALQDAFDRIPHPQPFGAGWSSVSGCGADLLNVDRVEATAYYREKLPAVGWTISRDDAGGLRANRGELVFTLTDQCGPVSVAIEQAAAPTTRVC